MLAVREFVWRAGRKPGGWGLAFQELKPKPAEAGFLVKKTIAGTTG